MLIDTFEKRKNKPDKVLEVRIPHRKQPPVNRMKKEDDIEEEKEERRRDPPGPRTQNQGKEEKEESKEPRGTKKREEPLLHVSELVRISCRVSQFSATRCLIINIDHIEDYQGQA